MKKAVSIILVIAICMSLNACGTKKTIQAIDDKILTLGEITLEDENLIIEIEEEIKLLSEKDKSKLQNYDILILAKSDIESIKTFQEDYNKLLTELAFFGLKCDELGTLLSEIWGIVGNNGLSNTLKYMTFLPESFDEFKNNIKGPYNKHSECLLADAYGWTYDVSLGITGKDSEKFHAFCLSFQTLLDDFNSMVSHFSKEIKTFKEVHSEKYPDEIALLDTLYLTTSAYYVVSLYIYQDAVITGVMRCTLAEYYNDLVANKLKTSNALEAADIFQSIE